MFLICENKVTNNKTLYQFFNAKLFLFIIRFFVTLCWEYLHNSCALALCRIIPLGKDTTRNVVKFGENAGNGLKCVFFDVRVLSLHREGVRYETNLLRHGTTAQKKARLEGRAMLVDCLSVIILPCRRCRERLRFCACRVSPCCRGQDRDIYVGRTLQVSQQRFCG